MSNANLKDATQPWLPNTFGYDPAKDPNAGKEKQISMAHLREAIKEGSSREKLGAELYTKFWEKKVHLPYDAKDWKQRAKFTGEDGKVYRAFEGTDSLREYTNAGAVIVLNSAETKILRIEYQFEPIVDQAGLQAFATRQGKKK